MLKAHRYGFDCEAKARGCLRHGLDFAGAALIFAGNTLRVQDIRKDLGQTRIICYGLLAKRMVVIGYTPRGTDRHIFSMRKANEREKARISAHI
ncbi:BrnT family toxin [Polaromonas vacuolata]|uniref:BrnT family toxin n=1 Tax=Polaromonas vacuolata TaxID=37448 RepID=UPI0014564933|nr:BrnT family toxin [Polaromonas vacuolata]